VEVATLWGRVCGSMLYRRRDKEDWLIPVKKRQPAAENQQYRLTEHVF